MALMICNYNTLLILLTGITSVISSSHAQRLYIDQVPEYSSLDGCAVLPLSTIVRDMANGCGDGSKTTSYDCFCSTSSEHFNYVIATAVSSHCSGTISHVVSALEVFQEYCQLAATMTSGSASSSLSLSIASGSSFSSSSSVPIATLSLSSFAAPVSVPTNPVSQPTMTATTVPLSAADVQTSMSSEAKAGIALGVIAVTGISLLGGIFLFRRWRQQIKINAQNIQAKSTNHGKSVSSQYQRPAYRPNNSEIHEIESRPGTNGIRSYQDFEKHIQQGLSVDVIEMPDRHHWQMELP